MWVILGVGAVMAVGGIGAVVAALLWSGEW